jgi:6-phosphogluconolactonase/glucosamine-6-phosphate isomerase/deaminase
MTNEIVGANGHLVRVFPGKPELGAELARIVAAHSKKAIARKGSFSVAISGGSLPAILKAGIEQLGEGMCAVFFFFFFFFFFFLTP